jgi:hypothetical protein
VGAERQSIYEAPTLARSRAVAGSAPFPRSTRGGDKKDLTKNMRLPLGAVAEMGLPLGPCPALVIYSMQPWVRHTEL